MLKLMQSESPSHSFKCAEIFCITPVVYNVACYLCGEKMLLQQFIGHFQEHHLKLKEVDLLENNSIKAEHLHSEGTELTDKVINISEEKEEKEEKEGKNDESKKTQNSVPVDGQNQLINDIVEDNHEWLEDQSLPSDQIGDVNKECKEKFNYSCPECNRHYRSKLSLRKHKHNVHSSVGELQQQERLKKMKSSKYTCEECHEMFRSARDLRGHKWKHTGIFCDICGKQFTQPGNMMRHKIRHTGIKAHQCKECDRNFFTEKELNSHMISHTGVMPVICEICGRRCRDRGVLTAHMRRHTGERPAKCAVCSKSFYSFHDLNIHAITHTSERPFKCDTCAATFQRKKALRVHKLLHTEDRKHVCKICGKKFAQSGGLSAHMRTHNAAIEKSAATEPQVKAIVIENVKGFNVEINSHMGDDDI